jgi:hypothetical protein
VFCQVEVPATGRSLVIAFVCVCVCVCVCDIECDHVHQQPSTPTAIRQEDVGMRKKNLFPAYKPVVGEPLGIIRVYLQRL